MFNKKNHRCQMPAKLNNFLTFLEQENIATLIDKYYIQRLEIFYVAFEATGYSTIKYQQIGLTEFNLFVTILHDNNNVLVTLFKNELLQLLHKHAITGVECLTFSDLKQSIAKLAVYPEIKNGLFNYIQGATLFLDGNDIRVKAAL